MIDGFKIAISNPSCIKTIFLNKKIQFTQKVDTKTGELVSLEYTAFYKSLYLKHYNNGKRPLYIRGNIIKYSKGLSNDQNFTLREALNGFIQLANELNIGLLDMNIVKLEWGLNFNLPDCISVPRFIDNILVYKGKVPSEIIYQNEGIMKVFELAQQKFKIYDKATQKKISHINVVRYEIVIDNGTLLRKEGIRTIADIMQNKKAVNVLNNMLLKPIPHFIFYDYSIIVELIPNRIRKSIIEYNNAKAWKKLITNNPELYRKKKKSFSNHVTKLTDIGSSWNTLFLNKVKEMSICLTN